MVRASTPSESVTTLLLGGAVALAAGLSAWNLCIAWKYHIQRQQNTTTTGRAKRTTKRRRQAAKSSPSGSVQSTNSDPQPQLPSASAAPFPAQPLPLETALDPLRIGTQGIEYVPWDWRVQDPHLTPLGGQMGDGGGGTGSLAAMPNAPAYPHSHPQAIGTPLRTTPAPVLELSKHSPNSFSLNSWTTADPSLPNSFGPADLSLDSLKTLLQPSAHHQPDPTHVSCAQPQPCALSSSSPTLPDDDEIHSSTVHSDSDGSILPSGLLPCALPAKTTPTITTAIASNREDGCGTDLLHSDALLDALAAYVRSPLFGNADLSTESVFQGLFQHGFGSGNVVPTGRVHSWAPPGTDVETAKQPSLTNFCDVAEAEPPVSQVGEDSALPQSPPITAVADPLAGTSLRLKVSRSPPVSFFNAVAAGDILLTSTQQPLKSLAGNLAVRMRKRKQVVLMVSPPSMTTTPEEGNEAAAFLAAVDIGTENTNHTVKAMCVAQSFVDFNDINIACQVEWVEGTLAILCFPGIGRKHLASERPEEAAIRIAGKSAPPPVHTAGLIANRLRAHGVCSLMVMGADSVVQALRSLCLVHNFVDRAHPVWFSPRFISTVSAEGKRSGIEMIVHQNPPMQPSESLQHNF